MSTVLVLFQLQGGRKKKADIIYSIVKDSNMDYTLTVLVSDIPTFFFSSAYFTQLFLS
jgi:hypothetical protein